jgi:hypothetical protein
MIALGFLLYPHRQAVYHPPPFQLQFTFHNLPVQGVTVSVGKEASNQFYLDVSVPGASPKAITEYSSSVFWTLQVPGKVTLASCNFKRSGCNAFTSRGAVYTEIDDVPVVKRTVGGWVFERKYILRASSFAWNENGLNIEAQLPIAQFSFTTTHKFRRVFDKYLKHLSNPSERLNYENPNVSMNYYIADARTYDWIGGPQPNFEYLYRGRPVVWNQRVSAMTESGAVNGVNSSAADWDSLRILGAGVLFGIAGGSLVGAIQEAIDAERKDSGSGKSEATTTA